MREFECDCCGTRFPMSTDHTEIIRRDFRGEPQPSKVEYLCTGCLREYEAFFEA